MTAVASEDAPATRHRLGLRDPDLDAPPGIRV